jgi:hypothetical protein
MITRHVVNRRPSLFAGVVYAGVPQRAINILGPIRNGDAVLLNEKILTARVNFSLRTSFAFLPEDGFCFVDRDSGEDLRIDFYNVDDVSRGHNIGSPNRHSLGPDVGILICFHSG